MWLTHAKGKWKWEGKAEDTVSAWNGEYPTDKDGCAYIKIAKDNKGVGWENKDCDGSGLALCESSNVTGMYKIFTGMSDHSRNKYTCSLNKCYHTLCYIAPFPQYQYIRNPTRCAMALELLK